MAEEFDINWFMDQAKGNVATDVDHDALLNKRNGGFTNSVDKMENAMQNIILQEMINST